MCNGSKEGFANNCLCLACFAEHFSMHVLFNSQTQRMEILYEHILPFSSLGGFLLNYSVGH